MNKEFHATKWGAALREAPKPQSGQLTHWEKLNLLCEYARQHGVASRYAAPPFHMGLWKLGLRFRPPLFWSFRGLVFQYAVGFFVIVGGGLSMFFTFMQRIPRFKLSTDEFGAMVLIFVVSSLIIGLLQARLTQRQARQLGLSSWEEFGKEGEPLRTGNDSHSEKGTF